MNENFIYRSSLTEDSGYVTKDISICVIYNHRRSIDKTNFKTEIKIFFETNSNIDFILMFFPKFLKDDSKIIFDQKEDYFELIPKHLRSQLKSILSIYLIDIKGSLVMFKNRGVLKFSRLQLKEIYRQGIQNIFKQNNGLIEAPESFHFVFPSGKHCSNFMRTGNVIVNSCEIAFIANSLLSILVLPLHNIYCDTSSILSIAYSLSELLTKYDSKFTFPQIHSFSSYSGIYDKDIRFNPESLILISASTSGNIIDRLGKERLINDQEVAILYFIGSEIISKRISKYLVCDLTYSNINPQGIMEYKSYTADCKLCKNNSIKINVQGDSFLMNSPNIVDVTLTKKDCPKFISPFVEQFFTRNKDDESILKVNFRENHDPNDQYEIFIDIRNLLERINNDDNKDLKFRKKFLKTLDLYVPTKSKYIIHLDDTGSKEAANFILDNYFSQGQKPDIISQTNLTKQLNKNVSGVALVVSSCTVSGRNLLQVSRSLRKYKNLHPSYISLLSRSVDKSYQDRLSKTMSYGGTPYKTIESIFCSSEHKSNSWIKEIEFIKEFEEFIDSKITQSNTDSLTMEFIDLRTSQLYESKRGLTNNIFLRAMNGEELKLRPNFAFFDFIDYEDTVTQAEVYFVISCYLNSLRHSDKEPSLKDQSYYHRSVLSPDNFTRFNDGVIQACLLRAARNIELNYSFDERRSRAMKDVIVNIIEMHKEEEGEALFEFIYAICSRKLRLIHEHEETIIGLTKSLVDDDVINNYINFFKFKSSN